MTNTRNILISGIVAVALSAGAVGIAQAVGGDEETNVSAAQEDRAARAALKVVEHGKVVSIAHDSAGVAAWEVEVFKPGQALESFSDRTATGRHIVVYLDRDFNWLEATVEGYGPAPEK
jgi:hypothetical protein